MSHALDQLLGAMSTSFGTSVPDWTKRQLPALLSPLYSRCNGGYFWGRALLLRPVYLNGVDLLRVEDWNAPSLWRSGYGETCQNAVFFAEDIFGCQLGVDDGRIVRFDPETAAVERVGGTVDEWLLGLLSDIDYATGRPLASEWERSRGALPIGQRLVPKIPFFLGGEYAVDNLIAMNDVEGMLLRSQTWNATKDLPDGQQVIFRRAWPQ